MLRSAAVLLLLSSASLHAQTIEDGLMMSKSRLCTGFLYTHDSWRRYWEGTLKRENGNIGTITTQSVTWFGNYGVTDRLNLIAMLPYVWTKASAGPLHGMRGSQDLTLAAKYALITTPVAGSGSLRAFLVGAVGTPTSHYTPDFLPLSIGLGGKRLSGRFTLSYHAERGWYANASTAYTRRANVKLDRPAYFADDRLYLSDRVAMPDVFDYVVSAGYVTKRVQIPISFSQQITLGGSDIRRQDMPFVSDRMDASRLDAVFIYFFATPKNLAVRLAAGYTLSGRNVGQSTTMTAGLLYTIPF